MKQTRAKNATEVLVAAKWMLEHVGWIKGQSSHFLLGRNVPDSFCAGGALAWAESDVYIKTQAYRILEGEMDNNIMKFNDAPDTTKQHVLDAFDRAIERSKL